MKYKSISKLYLLTTFLSVATISYDDWTEMEIHDSQVGRPKEQNPQECAAYMQSLCTYKTTRHAVVYARLDNAPEVSISEKDFLRVLPDSIDIITMRNTDHLSGYDREDMRLVCEDYGTKMLYYIDCATKDKRDTFTTSTVETVRTGTFGGTALGSEGSAADASVLKPLVNVLGQTPCLLVFESTPSLLPKTQRSPFDYFVLDISATPNEYDIETSVLYATGYGRAVPDRPLLTVTPDGTLTDSNGVTRNAIAGAVYGILSVETPLGDTAIYNISVDYYNTNIICKRIHGGTQFLNPTSVH